MKQSLLEHLVRECVLEVLNAFKEEDDNQPPTDKPEGGDDDVPNFLEPDEDDGSESGDDNSSPPSDDNGNSDSSSDEKGDDSAQGGGDGEEKSPPASSAPSSPSDLKGVVLVNPRDKSKLQPIPLKGNDAQIERDLHRVASALGGGKVKTSLGALRAVKDTIKNPSSTVYVYLGKYDPESEEVFVMADKSLQVAKDGTIQPTDNATSGGTLSSNGGFEPQTADAGEYASHLSNAGQTQPTGIDEGLRKLVRKMVRQTLSK